MINADSGLMTDDDDDLTIGPLQVAIHVVQNRHAGKQKSHWDKINKGNYHLKLCMPFICLGPVQLLAWRFCTM